TTFEEVLRVTYEEKETAFNCPRCGKTLELSFSICPYCQQDLTPKECKECGKKLDTLWKICPYCRAAQ
ncbi:MAG: zinc ribbon domain-containing protein, partial [Candidatus Omnitrophica bacterium]|nr:zinc ribbon domain-containing protein [Candidatus Omnitrophota bacterium]